MDHRILVVEDSPELLTIWRSLFDLTTSYDIRYCESYQEARAILANGFRPELILTDYYLGDGNGLEIFSESIRIESRPHCIVVTGKSVDAAEFKELKYRDCTFIQKPVKFPDLAEQVSRYFSQEKGPSEALCETHSY